MKPSRSVFLPVRGLRYHLREWGPVEAPLLVMLHGWMDVSASFQFVVDALAHDWHVVAPDWRGFGRSDGQGDAYWFPDYLGDLDALLEHYSPAAPARLVGHSLGGNVATMYAGVRPARVERLVTLDAFGLAETRAEQAPGRFEKWLAELATPAAFRPYPDFETLARRLQADNPRLLPERAAFLARELGTETVTGEVMRAADPAHRRVHPILYRRQEVLACWRRVRAPVLCVEPADAAVRHRLGVSDVEHENALACFRDVRRELVAEAGHNLHHDQPEALARIIEAFLLSDSASAASPEPKP